MCNHSGHGILLPRLTQIIINHFVDMMGNTWYTGTYRCVYCATTTFAFSHVSMFATACKSVANSRFIRASSLKPLSQLVMTTHGTGSSVSSTGDDIISCFSDGISQLLAWRDVSPLVWPFNSAWAQLLRASLPVRFCVSIVFCFQDRLKFLSTFFGIVYLQWWLNAVHVYGYWI